MDFAFGEDIFKALLNFFFNILTYGYVSQILLGIISLMAFFFFLVLLSKIRVIKFIVVSKYYFVKGYLYYWLREKFYFSRAYVETIKWTIRDWDWTVWVGILFAVIFIVGFVYGLIQVGLTTGQEVAAARNLSNTS